VLRTTGVTTRSSAIAEKAARLLHAFCSLSNTTEWAQGNISSPLFTTQCLVRLVFLATPHLLIRQKSCFGYITGYRCSQKFLALLYEYVYVTYIARVCMVEGRFPHVFNLATNADITTNATCGEQGSEAFCKLVEHVKRRPGDRIQCGVCDASSANERHPIDFAIDGSNRWWQSPTIANGRQFNWVTITLDLKQVGSLYTLNFFNYIASTWSWSLTLKVNVLYPKSAGLR